MEEEGEFTASPQIYHLVSYLENILNFQFKMIYSELFDDSINVLGQYNVSCIVF